MTRGIIFIMGYNILLNDGFKINVFIDKEMVCSLCEKLLFLCTTVGLYMLYFLKLCLNDMISYLLGLIVAAGVVLDITPMRKAYIVMTLFIIFLLAMDKNMRSNSKTFDLLATIFRPINLGVGMHKVVNYTKWNHVGILSALLILEIAKIFAGVYCILTLAIENIPGVWVIYWLLGALLLESGLGLLLYSIILICVLIYHNFYLNLLQSMGDWYLKDSINCIVSLDKNRIILEFQDL